MLSNDEIQNLLTVIKNKEKKKMVYNEIDVINEGINIVAQQFPDTPYYEISTTVVEQFYKIN